MSVTRVISQLSFVAAVIALGVAIPALVIILSRDPGNVKTISGVSPHSGEITENAGAGVAITPNIATASILFENTGVLSNIAGTAIGVSSATGDVTITNLGVTALAATDGISVDASTGSVTATYLLKTQTALSYGDANGPQVSYLALIGFFFTVPQNTWQNSVIPVFDPGFFPGILPGDGGQGDTSGIAWSVPTIAGTYTADVTCELYPSAINVETHQSISVALAFNANNVDPLVSGYIPIGGYQTVDLNTGTLAGNGPLLARRLSFSTTFHVCLGCPVVVGDVATIHSRMDHTSTAGIAALTHDVACQIQFSQTL